MCGADNNTAMVATMVNIVNVMRHNLSSTIAANFQSFSMAAVSSSSLILSVMILISFKMRLNSRWTPGGYEFGPRLSTSLVAGGGGGGKPAFIYF